jgi:hypothetical protein
MTYVSVVAELLFRAWALAERLWIKVSLVWTSFFLQWLQCLWYGCMEHNFRAGIQSAIMQRNTEVPEFKVKARILGYRTGIWTWLLDHCRHGFSVRSVDVCIAVWSAEYRNGWGNSCSGIWRRSWPSVMVELISGAWVCSERPWFWDPGTNELAMAMVLETDAREDTVHLWS